MKKLSLKTAKNMLSRKEMKAISGGYIEEEGTCCARQYRAYAPPMQGYYSSVACSLTKSAAESYAAASVGGGGNWCCDSCNSATWL